MILEFHELFIDLLGEKKTHKILDNRLLICLYPSADIIYFAKFQSR